MVLCLHYACLLAYHGAKPVRNLNNIHGLLNDIKFRRSYHLKFETLLLSLKYLTIVVKCSYLAL